MGYPRKNLVSLQDTPYYHCVARCVRRAWLWGFDRYAGKDYSHRKQWVIERLSWLSTVFAIEICAYAIMSDHYHLVVHVDAKRARDWEPREVIERWSRAFRIPTLVERMQKGETSDVERDAAYEIIENWRTRLYDISWFMRCLNEHLARRANAEDERSGRFWEGRFRSQALLDEAGLLTAMAYVDLNPIRAGIAPTPEASEFTSIFERIKGMHPTITRLAFDSNRTSVPLRPFVDDSSGTRGTLPYRLRDYLTLVDWTGRSIRADKRGFIDLELPPILERLHIDPDVWKFSMQHRGTVLGRAMGRLNAMRLHAVTLGQVWVRGLRRAETFYS